MISYRSWSFVISFLLVRSRCASVTLESRDFVPSKCEGDDCSTSVGSLGKLFRRVSQDPDAAVISILLGCVISALILVPLVLIIFTLVKRKRILDVEKRLISVDGESPFPPVSPSSRRSSRSSWAEKLRFARTQLWISTERDKSQVLFDDTSSMTSLDTKATLPFHDIPSLPAKPPAVLDQSSLSFLPKIDPTESCPPYTVLSVSGETQSTSFRDVETSAARTIRKLPELPSLPESAPMATAAPPLAPPPPVPVPVPGGSGSNAMAGVAQTIIANAKKPKRHIHPLYQHHGSTEPTRPRKGSLLSQPPLTVQKPQQPTEEEVEEDSADASHPKSGEQPIAF